MRLLRTPQQQREPADSLRLEPERHWRLASVDDLSP